MNPLGNEVSLEEKTVEATSVEPTPVDTEIDATPVEIEPEAPAPVFLQAETEPVEEIEEPVEEIEYAEEEYVPAAAPVYYQSQPMYADRSQASVEEATNWDYTHADDGGYYVTVIQDKDVQQRNVLLLGATALMLIVVLGGWGISLFQKSLDVGAIGDENSLAYLGVDVPMTVEEEEQKKNEDEGGGGGGGGKEDPNPVNQGDLPDQTKQPIRPPDPNVYRSDNFELKTPPPSTQGTRDFEQKYGRWGDPNSLSQIGSSGPGTGGGMGTGRGTGAGSGSGTGSGSGDGSGSGGGSGDGNGDGTGPGGRVPPPVRAAVTTPYRITFQPKATYTDEARSNNVQGAVRLKITLLASGQVGSIVPVTRLPYGLTERAIAAAKQIRFEPKMVNGVAVPVTVTREYTFTIY